MAKKNDLTGKRFGKLIAIRDSGERKNGLVVWLCECDCGNKKKVRSADLNSGNTRSCGCLFSENIEGKRYGKLTVIKRTDKLAGNGAVVWGCQCDCGGYKEVSTGDLNLGVVKSCGCLIYNDLKGKRVGKLTVLGKTEKRNRFGSVYWEAICDCGNKIVVNGNSLAFGKTKSCGCLAKEVATEKMEKIHFEQHKEGTNINLIDGSKIRKHNTSGVTGVYWNKRQEHWYSRIQIKGRTINLGTFKNKQDAINARKEAEEKYFKPILEKYGVIEESD